MHYYSKYLVVEYSINVTECPCGSRKDPVSCCGYVKPRIHTALLDKRNYIESDGIAIGLDYSLKRVVDGELLPIIGKAIIIQGHVRTEKNNKVVFMGNANQEYIMKPDALFEDYDEVFGIDTNTRKVENFNISMSGIVYAHKVEGGISCIPLTVLEFWDAQIPPEILGWYVLLEMINNKKDLEGKRIGIVVDSNLDDIDKYNRREKSIHDDHYLPNNVDLIYASSDKKVNIANKLISLCDKIASNQFKTMRDIVGIEHPPESIYPCVYFRQWMPDQQNKSGR